MTESRLDYLTCVMRVAKSAPVSWVDQPPGNLGEFYRSPNDAAWAGISRVLYHETLHFWQVFASGYLANLIAEDWSRVLAYESDGTPPPVGVLTGGFSHPPERMPFSALELTECWARYWDVHTRGPGQIIEEEGLSEGAPTNLRVMDPITGIWAYTSAAYDFLMTGQLKESYYGRPYGWAMETAGGNSAFVAICFPILVHYAFAGPKPVESFIAGFEAALRSKTVCDSIRARSGNINLDWILCWPAIVKVYAEAISGMRLPLFTPGADVIKRGRLGSHPIYARYLERLSTLRGMTSKVDSDAQELDQSSSTTLLTRSVTTHAARNFWATVALPGQPHYRYMLGFSLPPPAIVFTNLRWSAGASVFEKLRWANGEVQVSFEQVITNLEERVRRFRDAVYWRSLGIEAPRVA